MRSTYFTSRSRLKLVAKTCPACVKSRLGLLNGDDASRKKDASERTYAAALHTGDKHGNRYDNVFTHAGGRITWFAQPRQHEETPVIEKIIATADADLDDVAAGPCLF